MSYIKFDPDDSITKEFLTNIGIPDEVIATGELSPGIQTVLNVNSDALQIVASLDEERPGDNFLSGGESKTALELLKSRGSLALGIFRTDKCPGAGCPSAGIILENMLGKIPVTGFLGNIIPEEICHYDPRYSVDEQRGIHFFRDAVSDPIRKAGDAVALIVSRWGEDRTSVGAGIVISEKGDVLTAYHLVYDKDAGRFGDKIYIKVQGITWLIEEKDVIKKDKENDTVLFRVDRLAGRVAPIKVAATPPLASDPVWLIGFPLYEGEDSEPFGRKAFTVGRVSSITVSVSDLGAEIVSTALPTYGNSGGAMVSYSGEFLGIVKKMAIKGRENVKLLRPHESFAVMPPGIYTGTTEEIKKYFEDWPDRFKDR